MDTPAPANLSKGPRRKLKRVLKKNKLSSSFSHNNSNHSLYQKKLKNAINASLNLTSNVRTLQSNNRSLALQVSKLREELRRVFNDYMRLLENNHSLNERILELERQLDITPSIIEHEVNSRCQAKVQTMQNHIDLLLENASIFTKGLVELRECYTISPRKSGNSLAAHNSHRHQSTRLSRSGDTPLSSGHPPIKVGLGASRHTDEGSLKSPDAEMCMLVESSDLGDTFVASASPCLKDTSKEGETATSFLKSRFSSWPPQSKRQSKIEARGSSITSRGDPNNDKDIPRSTITLRRSGRRNSQLIRESRSAPQTDGEIFQELKDTACPELVSPGNEQRMKINEAIQFQGSPAEFYCGRGSSKVTSRNIQQACGKKLINNSEVTKSPPVSTEHMHMTEYETRTAEERLHDVSWSPQSPYREKTTYTIQDMDLTAVVSNEPYAQKTHMSPKLLPAPFEEHFSQDFQEVKSSVKSPVTKTSNSVFQNKETIGLFDKDVPGSKLTLPSSTRSQGRHARSNSAEDKLEAPSVPDAISMRVSKGGKLVFAVSRKGVDGSRATVQPAIRARSKPKKAQRVDKSETSNSAGDQDIDNIFDFHDKTPKNLQSNQRQNAMSVFSLSADESALSPLGALNQLREASKKEGIGKSVVEVSIVAAHIDSEEKSVSSPSVSRSRSRSRNVVSSKNKSRNKQCADHKEGESLDEKMKKQGVHCHSSEEDKSASVQAIPVEGTASTFVGEAYMEPLKGSPEARSRYRTRSQSRGRKKSLGKQSPESVRKSRSKSAKSGRRPSRGRSRRRDRDSASPEVLPKEIIDAQNSSAASEGLKEKINEDKKYDEAAVSEIQANNFKMATDSTQSSRSTFTITKPESKDDNRPAAENSERKSSYEENNLSSEHGIYSHEKELSKRIQEQSKTQVDMCENFEMSGSSQIISKTETCNNISLEKEVVNTCLKPTHSTEQKDEFQNLEKETTMNCQIDVLQKAIEVSGSISSPALLLDRDAMTNKSSCSGFSLNDNQIIYMEPLKGSPEVRPLDRRQSQSRGRNKSHGKLSPESKREMQPKSAKSKRSPSRGRSRRRDRDSASPQVLSKEIIDTQCSSAASDGHSEKINKDTKYEAEGSKAKVEAAVSGFNLKAHQMKSKHSNKDDQANVYKPSCVSNQTLSSQPEDKDSNTCADSPERTSSKQRQKKTSKSTSKKSKKAQKSQRQGSSDELTAAQSQCPQPGPDDEIMQNGQDSGTDDAISTHGNLKSCNGIMETGEEAKVIANSSPPQISKTENSSKLINFSTEAESLSPNREGRKRRAASNVSYVAPRLNSKLRRGDPFTSHYAAEKISIYKSPKTKAKEKAKLRRDVLGVLHNLAIKEDIEATDAGQD